MEYLKLFEDFYDKESNFKKWFEGSKIVDENNNPLIVYHGASFSNKFDEFRIDNIGKNYNLRFGKGFYFTEIKQNAFSYSNYVFEVYLNIKNPLEVKSSIEYRDVVNNQKKKLGYNRFEMDKLLSKDDNQILAEMGYDGIIYWYNGKMNEIVAFYPNQIKSATDNRGTYDSSSNIYT